VREVCKSLLVAWSLWKEFSNGASSSETHCLGSPSLYVWLIGQLVNKEMAGMSKGVNKSESKTAKSPGFSLVLPASGLPHLLGEMSHISTVFFSIHSQYKGVSL
jgi:hypothetical protein